MLVRLLSCVALVSVSACAPAPAGAQATTPGKPGPIEPAPAAGPAAKKPGLPPSPCVRAEHHQFDFWLGEWNVRTAKGKPAGRNRIVRAHRGCALTEHWTSVRGGTGTSINHWNPATKQWVQHWVDGTGGIIDLAGGLRGNAMHLVGSYTQADGKTTRLRGIWTPLADGRVRQLFEESKDNGATWTVWFDGYYAKRR